MKTLLVPTDFSENAETAMLFAIILAQKLNAKLILIHAYEIPAAAAPVSFELMQLEKKEYKSKAENNLKSLSQQLKHVKDLQFEMKLEEGSVLEVLLANIKKQKIDLVVMGTKGAGAFSGAVFGSTTSNLMAKTDCPVMAIPLGVKFSTELKKLSYATDYKQSDIQAISKLVEIASLFHAQINVLHISGDEINAEDEVQLMNDFMKKVNAAVNYNNISFQILHGNNVEEKLEEYINQENTDMLVMATHQRSFMDRLFGQSTTKKIALDTKTPLLAFHYSKVPEVRIY